MFARIVTREFDRAGGSAASSEAPGADAPDDATLLSGPIRGPGFQEGGSTSDWWLPGCARLCVTLGDGAASLLLRNRHFAAIPRLALIGPTDRAHRVVVDGARIVSFQLTPLGWSRLIRRPASHHRNLVEPLADVTRAPLSVRLADALADAVERPVAGAAMQDRLLSLAAPHRDEAMIVQLARLVADPATHQVRDMHDRLGISEARLRSLALRHFGSPTKILLRHARFLRSLARVDYTPGHNSYANIDPTYHDVSHFLRDADYFLGTTPRRFRLLSSQH